MYIKLFTKDTFNRHGFAAILNGIAVQAIAVDGGVILDRTTLNRIPAKELPTWVYVNRTNINSRLHTRPATPDEIEQAQGTLTYSLYHFNGEQWIKEDESNDFRPLRQKAVSWAAYCRGLFCEEWTPKFCITDNETGEIIYEI